MKKLLKLIGVAGLAVFFGGLAAFEALSIMCLLKERNEGDDYEGLFDSDDCEGCPFERE